MTSESRRKEAREKLLAATHSTPAPEPQPLEYIGLITRVIAFTLDLVVINGVAILTTGAISLFRNVFGVSTSFNGLFAILGAIAYFLWVLGYFVTFWATTGQTPGDRVLRIKVVSSIAGPIKPRRAVLRLGALILGAIPLFAGYAMILFDDKRRAFHDHVARTNVVDATFSRTPGVLIGRHPARKSPEDQAQADALAERSALSEHNVLTAPDVDEPDA